MSAESRAGLGILLLAALLAALAIDTFPRKYSRGYWLTGLAVCGLALWGWLCL